MADHTVSITGLPGIPIVQAGDDLAALVVAALRESGLDLVPGDALVVTSKIVSKAEGRLVDLRAVTPSPRAEELATLTDKDPRLVELILQESDEVVRAVPGVLLVRHRLGFTSANAAIDRSNVNGDEDSALLMPLDPDASAVALRGALLDATGVAVPVVISDTHGRPWRKGNVNVAVGMAGLPALVDLTEDTDLFGRAFKATIVPLADQLASAATLVTGEGAEGIPVVLVRGVSVPEGDGRATEIVRLPDEDLFR